MNVQNVYYCTKYSKDILYIYTVKHLITVVKYNFFLF